MKKSLFLISLLACLSLGSILPSLANASEPSSSIISFDSNSLIKADGTYWVWGGSNMWGDNQSVPTQIQGLTDVAASFDGQLVMKKDGSVWHWERQMQSMTNIKITPVQGVSQLVDVQVFYDMALVLDADGQVYIAERQDNKLDLEHFTKVKGLDDVVKMNGYWGSHLVFSKKDGSVWLTDWSLKGFTQATDASSSNHVQGNMILQKNGTVLSWPSNPNLNIDSPWNGDSLSAVPVQGLSGIQSLWTNKITNLAIDNQTRLWYWGATVTWWDGKVYRDYIHYQPYPVLLSGVQNVKEAYIVELSLIVLTNDGKVYETSIARDSMPSSPGFKLLATGVDRVKPDKRHIIMQKKDRSLWGWGINKEGQLGCGDYAFDHLTPVPVQAPVELVLNGVTVGMSNGVIIRAGQAFVPLRSIFEKLGAKITWDNVNKIATIERSGSTNNSSSRTEAVIIRADYKSGSLTLNNELVKLQNDPFGVGGISYLPLRFISESLGAKVEWMQKEGKILITLK